MKRGRYDFSSPENKAKVAKYALENGVTASFHHFKQTGEFNNLKESTVHGWVKQYWSELRAAAGESSTITAYVKKLCKKKQGTPLLLGEDLERQVQEFISVQKHKFAEVYAQRFAPPLRTRRFCFFVLLCKSRFLLVLHSTNLYTHDIHDRNYQE